LVDILRQLPEVHNALPGALDCNVFHLWGGQRHYLLLFESLADRSNVDHYHFS
jgi:hypothetical protein